MGTFLPAKLQLPQQWQHTKGKKFTGNARFKHGRAVWVCVGGGGGGGVKVAMEILQMPSQHAQPTYLISCKIDSTLIWLTVPKLHFSKCLSHAFGHKMLVVETKWCCIVLIDRKSRVQDPFKQWHH